LAVADARAQTPASKPGYTVTLAITFDEKGEPEDCNLVEAKTDDPTGDKLLVSLAIAESRGIKLPPRTKDGKPIKFKGEVPFEFPVEGDEGAAANLTPKPKLHGDVVQPVYPPELAAKGEVGGAILELIVGTDGKVKTVRALRSSHPEFAEAAKAAVQQWNFIPAMTKGGDVFESRWRIAVSFSINGREPDWTWRVAPRPSLGGFVAGRVTVPAKLPAVSVQPAPAVPGEPAPAPVK